MLALFPFYENVNDPLMTEYFRKMTMSFVGIFAHFSNFLTKRAFSLHHSGIGERARPSNGNIFKSGGAYYCPF